MKPKSLISLALSIYLLATFIIVFGHSFLESFGFHFDYTISRYIGLTTWSALFFLVISLIIFALVFKYILYLKKTYQMSRLWWIISVITVVSLIGVGLCPIGYFDKVYGDFGVVSHLHRLFSNTMFCLSILMVFLTALKFHKIKSFFIPSVFYIIYTLAFVVCYASNFSFFFNHILIFEALFLTFFYIIMLLVPSPLEKGKSESGSRSLDK